MIRDCVWTLIQDHKEILKRSPLLIIWLFTVYTTQSLTGLIYCMCTAAGVLIFYGFSKSNNMLNFVFTNNLCSKRKYIPEKMPYFRKTEICKLR